MAASVEQKVKEIICEQLGVEEYEVTPNATRNAVSGHIRPEVDRRNEARNVLVGFD